ncbi:MAG: putative toxin-antitoxin system toxin component, PIN family [Treponema sp.]|nr:putative toxin-antitoxin system toxin component, PIN family [Treponema sp.]
MTRVVLDTNVLVSALLSNGAPAAVVDLVTERRIILFYNDNIIAEYWDVLQRAKFDIRSQRVTRLINAIVKNGISAENALTSAIPMPDEDDRKFYDVAKASSAFLITGNLKHFPKEPFIVNPSSFLKLYYLNEQ